MGVSLEKGWRRGKGLSYPACMKKKEEEENNICKALAKYKLGHESVDRMPEQKGREEMV